ncbi:precorrin-3B C(17)-methyltransferase [Aquabacter sp. L1I39]|uniref:precorrin-3B C(17)-methyltransferase n=1 Tax=Aquabacter sp. L1I39 TaxID=2820278 RepID=UPI001ADCF99B|nr:precorrin-3B C(17)-methyltransferase [Aquabacter sp. L1I39]QTL05587.1 precorrin-3B C(17)-methyltransferase [Aquabacter sp. L1I39]
MSGSLRIVGLGPGAPDLLTPQAEAALEAATDVFGYAPYVARVAEREGCVRHASDNGEELVRARAALAAAAEGRHAVIVSGGDPGVFAMAAAVFEALEEAPDWRDLDIAVVPGITAMLAAAAAVGAPLGHDFCAINLSDNLKSWSVIERRLRLAAEADFAIALYNPRSKARPDALGVAFCVLREAGAGERLVMLVRDASRPGESVAIAPLEKTDPLQVDMRTLVIIGSSATRQVGRWVYTPRRGP